MTNLAKSAVVAPSSSATAVVTCSCQTVTPVTNIRHQQQEGRQVVHPSSSSLSSSSQCNRGPTSSSSSSCTSIVLCETCVANALYTARLKRETALQQRNQARLVCAQQLSQRTNKTSTTSNSSSSTNHHRDLSQLIEETRVLKQRLQHLQQTCSSTAVAVASAVVETEERKSKLLSDRNFCRNRRIVLMRTVSNQEDSGDDQQKQQYELVARKQLYELQSSLLDGTDGAMSIAYHTGIRHVQLLRYQWALQAFAMFRLDKGTTDSTTTTQSKLKAVTGNGKGSVPTTTTATVTTTRKQMDRQNPRGIGKIAGLPLPHAGPELYEFLPPLELQSALRLIATCTQLVAQCLAIPLPHPIVLSSSAGNNASSPNADDIVDVMAMLSSKTSSTASSSSSSSLSMPPLAWWMSSTAHSNTSKGNDSRRTIPSTEIPSRGSTTTTTSATAASSLAASTSSLLSLVGGAAKQALVRATNAVSSTSSNTMSAATAASGSSGARRSTNQQHHHRSVASKPSTILEHTTSTSSSSFLPALSMDSSKVTQRIQHATVAILSERATSPTASSAASSYALEVSQTKQETFGIGLQLLQNNVLALCIRAGVPVDMLWPGQALLLNLDALQTFCHEQVVLMAGVMLDGTDESGNTMTTTTTTPIPEGVSTATTTNNNNN